jgi:hypothetical protein
MSRSMGKTLPNDTTDRTVSTRLIVHAKPNAGVLAKIELGEITVQVCLSAQCWYMPFMPRLRIEKKPLSLTVECSAMSLVDIAI